MTTYVVSGGKVVSALDLQAGDYVLVQGTMAGATIHRFAGGDVLNGGRAVETQILGGEITVNSGGIASGTVIGAGGKENIWRGGSSLHAIVESGGIQDLSPEATAIGTRVERGGIERVEGDEATAQDTVLDGGTLEVMGGARVTNVRATAAGGTVIYNTYNGSGLVVAGRGQGVPDHLIIQAQGAATALTVQSGGRVDITPNGGQVTDVRLGEGGYLRVDNLDVARNVTVDGGTIRLRDGGVLSGVTITDRGGTEILDGTSADITQVAGKGTGLFTDLVIENGASANRILIENGGTAELLAGGYASDIYLGGGTLVRGAGSLISTLFVTSAHSTEIIDGTTVSGTSVANAAGSIWHLIVQNGGHIVGTRVGQDGIETVGNAGNSLKTEVQSGGLALVESRGVARNTVIKGGIQRIDSGGLAENTEVDSGSEIVNRFGSAHGAFVRSGGTEHITALGRASNVKLDGGTLLLDAGAAVSGVSFGYYGGTEVFNGFISSGVEVGPIGSYRASHLIVQNGGESRGTRIEGNGPYHRGREDVESGGIDWRSVIGRDGLMFVHSHGLAVDETVLQGGTIVVEATGRAEAGLTLEKGNAVIEGGMGAGSRITFQSGGFLTLGHPDDVKADLLGFGVGARITLPNFAYDGVEKDFRNGVLELTNRAGSTHITFTGHYVTGNFVLSEKDGGTVIDFKA
jgi:autotransporter passenger strand-loop-strand repeat protein